MKWFKSFKEYTFNYLLPRYFKDQDTYKDVSGKGILERFIEVCSEYFDTDVLPDIDNLLENIDPDTAPDLFLNYLWEYLGEIPYAYGVIYQENIPYSRKDLSNWVSNSDAFPRANTRKILKYAISLYKIRCTQPFYDILGRFYGVRFIVWNLGDNIGDNPVFGPSVSILDPADDNSYDPSIDFSYYDTGEHYDIDMKHYDSAYGCWECTKLDVTILIPKGIWDLLEEKGTLEEAKQSLVDILNKYLPIHVRLLTTENVSFGYNTVGLVVTGPPDGVTYLDGGSTHVVLPMKGE